MTSNRLFPQLVGYLPEHLSSVHQWTVQYATHVDSLDRLYDQSRKPDRSCRSIAGFLKSRYLNRLHAWFHLVHRRNLPLSQEPALKDHPILWLRSFGAILPWTGRDDHR